MIRISLALILLILLSCQNEVKFNSELWKPYESGVVDGKYRKKMVNDLVKNQIKTEQRNPGKSSTYREIIQLIGEPESIDTLQGKAKFLIDEKFDYNIDPNGYIYLELYFNKDSLLQKWILIETEFEP